MSSHYLDPTRQIVAKTMMSRIPTKINSINALVFTENRRNYLITYFKNALLKVEDKIFIVQKSGPLRTHRNFPLSNPFGGIFVDLSEGFDEGWSNIKIRLRVHDIIVTNDLDNDDRNRMADSDSDDECIRQYFQTAYILVYVLLLVIIMTGLIGITSKLGHS